MVYEKPNIHNLTCQHEICYGRNAKNRMIIKLIKHSIETRTSP